MKAILFLSLVVVLGGCGDEGGIPTATVTPSVSAAPSTPPVVHRETSTDNLRRVFQLKELKQIPLTIGKAHVKVWIMDNFAKREEGMMWLTNGEVRNDEGMIFVFSSAQHLDPTTGEPRMLSFWMKNTILPLDLIFLGPDKKVLNIAAGKSYSEAPIPAKGPAQYVIELKQGTAKRLGIKPGDKAQIPDSVKSLDNAS